MAYQGGGGGPYAGNPYNPNQPGGYPGGYAPPPGAYAPPPGAYAPQNSSINPEVQRWFTMVDRDHSGKISAEELKMALVNGKGENFSDNACRLMIGMFDSDEAGTIDINGFDKLYTYINQWLSVFKTYDLDQSGHIEESELTQAFTTMGFRFSPTFVEFLMKKCSVGNQKQISVDQFIVLCVQIQRFTECFRARDTDKKGVITIDFEDFLKVAIACSI